MMSHTVPDQKSSVAPQCLQVTTNTYLAVQTLWKHLACLFGLSAIHISKPYCSFHSPCLCLLLNTCQVNLKEALFHKVLPDDFTHKLSLPAMGPESSYCLFSCFSWCPLLGHCVWTFTLPSSPDYKILWAKTIRNWSAIYSILNTELDAYGN